MPRRTQCELEQQLDGSKLFEPSCLANESPANRSVPVWKRTALVGARQRLSWLKAPPPWTSLTRPSTHVERALGPVVVFRVARKDERARYQAKQRPRRSRSADLTSTLTSRSQPIGIFRGSALMAFCATGACGVAARGATSFIGSGAGGRTTFLAATDSPAVPSAS